MTVSDRTRRLVWALAGQACCLCRRPLVLEGTEEKHSLVGEVAHIISSRPGGPRFVADVDPRKLDLFPNLLLLCDSHHTMIDDYPEEWTVERLRDLKKSCERRVSDRSWHDYNNGVALLPTSIEPDLELIIEVDDLNKLLSTASWCRFGDLSVFENRGDQRFVAEAYRQIEEVHDLYLQNRDVSEMFLQDVNDPTLSAQARATLDRITTHVDESYFAVVAGSRMRTLMGPRKSFKFNETFIYLVPFTAVGEWLKSIA